MYIHTHITHITSHASHPHPFIFCWSLSLRPWLPTVNSAAVKVAVHVSFRIMVLPDISPGIELQNQMLQYSEKKGSLQVWALLSELWNSCSCSNWPIKNCKLRHLRIYRGRWWKWRDSSITNTFATQPSWTIDRAVLSKGLKVDENNIKWICNKFLSLSLKLSDFTWIKTK